MGAIIPSGEVVQASANVAVQAGCSVDDAIELMRERADAIDRTIDYVAKAVNSRKMVFGIRGGRGLITESR